jgi:hypothetical protein
VCPLIGAHEIAKEISHEPTAFICVALPAPNNSIRLLLRRFQYSPNYIVRIAAA